MKESKQTNKVRINYEPTSFDKVYKGECNGNEFNLTYLGRYNAATEEIETAVSIVWRAPVEPQNSKILEEGIRKLFRKRLDNDSERN